MARRFDSPPSDMSRSGPRRMILANFNKIDKIDISSLTVWSQV